MRSYRFIVERDPETNLLVGYVPGWPGAHTQGALQSGGEYVSESAVLHGSGGKGAALHPPWAVGRGRSGRACQPS